MSPSISDVHRIGEVTLSGRRAYVRKQTVTATRLAGIANPATVKNQAQAEMPPFLRGQELAELMLDLDGVLGRSEAQPPRQTPDVGVYG